MSTDSSGESGKKKKRTLRKQVSFGKSEREMSPHV